MYECMLYVLSRNDVICMIGFAAGCVNNRYLKGSEKILIEVLGGKDERAYKVVPR